jgi:CHRD domain
LLTDLNQAEDISPRWFFVSSGPAFTKSRSGEKERKNHMNPLISLKKVIFVVFAVAALILAGLAIADPGARFFRAILDGYHETPLSISTNATGSFQASLNPTGDQLTYELQFSGLEGGNTLFAHVHIGQPGTSGGVMFFLCGGGSKPAPCPNGAGTVTGTVTAADIGPAGQGVAAGEFQEAIAAMRDGAAYANVHTVMFAPGEIRGQINAEQF